MTRPDCPPGLDSRERHAYLHVLDDEEKRIYLEWYDNGRRPAGLAYDFAIEGYTLAEYQQTQTGRTTR